MGEAPDDSNARGMINRASRVLSRGTFLLGGAVCAGVLGVPTAVRAARALRLVLFPGGMNWTTFIARDKGFFAREGLDVAITPTPNSVQLFSKLMAGEYDVASTALDNVVAYDEGQGDRMAGYARLVKLGKRKAPACRQVLKSRAELDSSRVWAKRTVRIAGARGRSHCSSFSVKRSSPARA